jgi:hypothetical protein
MHYGGVSKPERPHDDEEALRRYLANETWAVRSAKSRQAHEGSQLIQHSGPVLEVVAVASGWTISGIVGNLAYDVAKDAVGSLRDWARLGGRNLHQGERRALTAFARKSVVDQALDHGILLKLDDLTVGRWRVSREQASAQVTSESSSLTASVRVRLDTADPRDAIEVTIRGVPNRATGTAAP